MKQIKFNLILLGLIITTTIQSALVSNTEELVSTLGEIKEQLPPPYPPRKPRLPARTIRNRKEAENILKEWRYKKISPQEANKAAEGVRAALEGILNWLRDKSPLTGMPELDRRNFKKLVNESINNIKNIFPGSSEVQGLADGILKEVEA